MSDLDPNAPVQPPAPPPAPPSPPTPPAAQYAAPAAPPVPPAVPYAAPAAPPAPPAAPYAAPAAPPAAPTDEQLKQAASQANPFKPIVPQPWMAPYLGPNGLPAGIGAFNWGAFFFGWIWALVYGMNNWGFLALGVAVAGRVLARAGGSALSGVIGLAQLAFAIWFALNINKAYWAVNPKRLSVEEFKSKQVKWIIIGVALFAVLLVLAVVALVLFATLAGTTFVPGVVIR